MTMKLHRCTYKSEAGAALITALIFLVIMTLLALTSMNTTTLEEKMAANSQEINRVFQAAETGLARAYNDDAAFNTSHTTATPYWPAATDIGPPDDSYNATMRYKAVFVQATKPPREAMFEVGTAQAYHFDFEANASAQSGTAQTLNQGAYQIGPSGVN